MSGGLIIRYLKGVVFFNVEKSIPVKNSVLSFLDKARDAHYFYCYYKYDDISKKISIQLLKEYPDLKKFASQNFSLEVNDIEILDTNNIIPNVDIREYKVLLTAKPKTEKKQINIYDNYISETIIKEIELSFDALDFKNGYVEFQQKFYDYSYYSNYVIYNDYLKEEFNHLKKYFVKYFKTSKVKIKLSLNVRFGTVESYVAQSTLIDKINSDIIENINCQIIEKLQRKPKALTSKKILYTEDDIFTQYKDNNEGYLINQTEIIKNVLASGHIRNAQQINYFIDIRHDYNEKIRFTLKPEFGFLFYVKTGSYSHFCWELLDKNATYVWTIHEKVADKYSVVEKEIGFIIANKRNSYLQLDSLKNDSFIFHRIFHKVKNFTSYIAFNIWKENIEKLFH